MNRSSADKILGDYCSPFNFPEDKDETGDCIAQHELHSAETSSQADERKEVLEGDPLFDPLAKYGSEEPESREPCVVPDRGVLEKMHCHRHDDLIVHCGCKPQKQTSQNNAAQKSVIDGEEHDYVLVEEEQDTAGLKVEEEEDTTGLKHEDEQNRHVGPFSNH